MRAATVVQQLHKSCRTCFKFYCMFYFTCDRCLSQVFQVRMPRSMDRERKYWFPGLKRFGLSPVGHSGEHVTAQRAAATEHRDRKTLRPCLWQVASTAGERIAKFRSSLGPPFRHMGPRSQPCSSHHFQLPICVFRTFKLSFVHHCLFKFVHFLY